MDDYDTLVLDQIVLTDQDDDITYPDSDGQLMADNTQQLDCIVWLKGGLDVYYRYNPFVFVASNLLWYPEKGCPHICCAPDIMIVFGRPKGYRGSYKQWEEDNIAPQVVFEILSPSNDTREMAAKFEFYNKYGVEEYYVYDPKKGKLTGWQRVDGDLYPIEPMDGWVSPWLGLCFEMQGTELHLIRPDGKRLLTPIEQDEERELAERQRELAERQRELAEWQRERAEQQRELAEQQREQERQQRERAEQQRERAEQQREQERQQRERAEQQRELAEQQREQERQQRELAEQQRELAEQQRELAEQQREQERQQRLLLIKKLREMGIDPDTFEE